jgi:hypothetical protein
MSANVTVSEMIEDLEHRAECKLHHAVSASVFSLIPLLGFGLGLIMFISGNSIASTLWSIIWILFMISTGITFAGQIMLTIPEWWAFHIFRSELRHLRTLHADMTAPARKRIPQFPRLHAVVRFMHVPNVISVTGIGLSTVMAGFYMPNVMVALLIVAAGLILLAIYAQKLFEIWDKYKQKHRQKLEA